MALAGTETRRPPETGPFTTFLTSVERRTPLNAGMVAVTLAGGDLEHFRPLGPDTFVYVLLPPPGHSALTIDRSFTWTGFYEMPEALRPVGAYYTVRRHRPDVHEIDLEMVTHGDAGPGTRFAGCAAHGDPVALWGPRFIYAPEPDDAWQLLVGDETALPAIAGILETRPAGARTIAVVEVENADHEVPLRSGDGITVLWLHRGTRPAGTSELLLDSVRELTFPPGRGYAWGGGESRAMTRVRKHLRHERGFAKRDTDVIAYWRHSDSPIEDDE